MCVLVSVLYACFEVCMYVCMWIFNIIAKYGQTVYAQAKVRTKRMNGTESIPMNY